MTTRSMDEALARQRALLDDWLDQRFPAGQQRQYNGELEAGYPLWPAIEGLLAQLFNERRLRALSRPAVGDLMFFISRSDEGGRVIDWLHPGRRAFSNIADLSEEDFLWLCEESLSLPEDSSDYQLAACFEKLTDPRAEYLDLLLRFFGRRETYTRRRALHSLAHLGHERVEQLVLQLWEADCEFARLSCLHCLKQSSPGSALFHRLLAEYRTLYDVDQQDYRRSQLERLLG